MRRSWSSLIEEFKKILRKISEISKENKISEVANNNNENVKFLNLFFENFIENK